MHGIVCNCAVLNVIALYRMVPSCIGTVIVILSDWCGISVVRSENLKKKKVTCPACWIYTGTLWRKELLSELTEGRLGMWVVYIHIEHCIHNVFLLQKFGALLWIILANHKVNNTVTLL